MRTFTDSPNQRMMMQTLRPTKQSGPTPAP